MIRDCPCGRRKKKRGNAIVRGTVDGFLVPSMPPCNSKPVRYVPYPYDRYLLVIRYYVSTYVEPTYSSYESTSMYIGRSSSVIAKKKLENLEQFQ